MAQKLEQKKYVGEQRENGSGKGDIIPCVLSPVFPDDTNGQAELRTKAV